VAIGPWNQEAAGRGWMRASDADRDRVVRALAARTHADLVAVTAGLAARRSPSAPAPPSQRKRATGKVVAGSACAIVLPPAVIAAFLTFYGGFIILFLVACAGVVVSSAPIAPRRPGVLPSAGRR
jgi:predicted MFS family arabinose efflux permease